MKTRIILATLLVCFFFVNCTKSDSDETVIQEPNIVIKTIQSITRVDGSIYEQYQNGKVVKQENLTYEYNGPNGMLSKVTELQSTLNPNSVTYNYTYNTDNKIQTIDYKEANTNIMYTEKFIYSPNNINAKIYLLPNLTNVEYEYNYSTINNVVTKSTQIYPTANIVNYTYDANGNLFSESAPDYTSTNTYDTKPSQVAKNLKGMFGTNYKINAVLLPIYKYHELTNNVLSENTMSSTLTIPNYTYTYIYDSEGQVLKKTSNTGEVLTYNYN